ncbi:MAG: hypothetical protein HY650_05610 [Acidobacteria bacterium]|nr:hypothetical protein [Acidobacteriota bacterium]
MTCMIGVDVGQSQDYTGISLIEVIDEYVLGVRQFHCRHIERLPLGLTYHDIISRVGEIVHEVRRADPMVVIDATGCGRPVVELARRELKRRIIGMTVTGGHQATTADNDWNIPKVELISTLQIALQADPPDLLIAAELPGIQALIEELLNYRVEIRSERTETFGPWRESIHDDLLLSLAIGFYAAKTIAGPLRQPGDIGIVVGTMKLPPWLWSTSRFRF